MLALLHPSVMASRKFKPSALKSWQKEDAERVRALLESARRTPGWISQADFADKHNIGSQSMLSQYASGKRPLNFEAALAIAKGLGVAVARVSPTFARLLAEAPPSFDDATAKPAATTDPKISELDRSLLSALASLEPGMRMSIRSIIQTMAVVDMPSYHEFIQDTNRRNHERDRSPKARQSRSAKTPKISED